MKIEESLKSARVRLNNVVDDGMACPCCGRFARRYRRPLSPTITRALRAIYRAATSVGGAAADGGTVFVDVRRIRGLTGCGDYARAEWWGLLERRAPSRGVRALGMWRLTNDGVAFVEGRLKVPRYAVVFAGKRVGVEGPDVGVDDIKKKRARR